MILIADSGSTKTDWRLIDLGNENRTSGFVSSGINPYYESEDEIISKLKGEVLPFVGDADLDEIRFYGAGCTEVKKEMMNSVLRSVLGDAQISVESDLMAAAHALLGRETGIACILGTGSNSCFYDGERILDNVSPLGFILGDEGSGAVLGKQFIGDLLKKQLPQDLSDIFWQSFPDLKQSDVIERVYRKPFPNRYLAQFTRFLGEHRDYEYVRHLLTNSFKAFLRRNVMQYDYQNYQTHFVGSVAAVFEDELREAADDCSVMVGQVMRTPMEGLIRFYQS
ncbi:MAG: ATPase [Paludibacteraceae bacterium]|nr:ATPase [Paludibacteraceae bacterium]